MLTIYPQLNVVYLSCCVLFTFLQCPTFSKLEIHSTHRYIHMIYIKKHRKMRVSQRNTLLHAWSIILLSSHFPLVKLERKNLEPPISSKFNYFEAKKPFHAKLNSKLRGNPSSPTETWKSLVNSLSILFIRVHSHSQAEYIYI